MSKKTFEKIAEGLTEALAISRGEAQPARLHVPAELNVCEIRSKLKMSQESFAYSFGFTVHQIRQWEQGRNRPLGAMRAYLMVIDRNPDAVFLSLRAPDASAAA